MSNTNTGGPAFPTKQYNRNIMAFEEVGGMTLRDYFAAKAMQALIIANGPSPQGGWPTYAERTAYTIAEAMLKAREA
jgi:hypothetical protein